MAGLDDIRAERLKKRDMLSEAGMNPYGAETAITHTLEDFLEAHEQLESSEEEVSLAGRVMMKREFGAIMFAQVFDGTARAQFYFKKDEMDEAHFTLFCDAIDTGDFVEARGTAVTTKTGEKSLLVKDWNILTKSLRPLPDKHHGLVDQDERYRKRYLDIMQDEELRELFERKATYWQATRDFLIDEGFLEVETPTLEITTGGAEARPFRTHHNDYDMDVFLRISVGELWQKRLMASGIPRTFEMGRVFRNEGTSPEHLQEYTSTEFYAAYMNFDEGLDLLERHIRYVIEKTFGGTMKFSIRGDDVDFAGEWKRIDYVEEARRITGIDVLEASEDEMRAKLEELGVEYAGDNRERLTDSLWKYCRKSIVGPVWLTGHPTLVSPLAKRNPDDERKTLRAQLIVAGSEMNNCFAELNDPIDQAERFHVQKTLIAEGDEEAMMSDHEFVEMLEHGMPPTFGASTLGERFFAFLVDKPVRDTQLFPLLKPRSEGDEKETT